MVYKNGSILVSNQLYNQLRQLFCPRRISIIIVVSLWQNCYFLWCYFRQTAVFVVKIPLSTSIEYATYLVRRSEVCRPIFVCIYIFNLRFHFFFFYNSTLTFYFYFSLFQTTERLLYISLPLVVHDPIHHFLCALIFI